MYNENETDLRFDWDPAKARTNARKHGVSFQEAATAFLDEEGLLLEGENNPEGEERFVLLGLGTALRIVVVVHCLREDERVVRIVSARKASQSELGQYEERLKR
jgi:uncharacterized DUF497 family protein